MTQSHHCSSIEMRFQGLKLTAIAKAIKIVLKNALMLLLFKPFIQGSQHILQTPSQVLSTDASSLSKASTFNTTHLSYSFDFFSYLLYYSISSRAYIHFLYSCSLCNKSPDFCCYLLASPPSPSPPQALHCQLFTSATLWPLLLLLFVDVESACPHPAPLGERALWPTAGAGGPHCAGWGASVLPGVSRGRVSTLVGKPLNFTCY